LKLKESLIISNSYLIKYKSGSFLASGRFAVSLISKFKRDQIKKHVAHKKSKSISLKFIREKKKGGENQ